MTETRTLFRSAILAASLTFSLSASASDAVNSNNLNSGSIYLLNACMNEATPIGFCQNFNRTVKTVQEGAQNTLRALGLETTAVVVGSAAHLLTEKQIKMQTQAFYKGESEFSVSEKNFAVNLKWNF